MVSSLVSAGIAPSGLNAHATEQRSVHFVTNEHLASGRAFSNQGPKRVASCPVPICLSRVDNRHAAVTRPCSCVVGLKAEGLSLSTFQSYESDHCLRGRYGRAARVVLHTRDRSQLVPGSPSLRGNRKRRDRCQPSPDWATGLGRAVLHAALDKAWNADCYKVLLATGYRRESTLRFYEGAGFQQGGKLTSKFAAWRTLWVDFPPSLTARRGGNRPLASSRLPSVADELTASDLALARRTLSGRA